MNSESLARSGWRRREPSPLLLFSALLAAAVFASPAEGSLPRANLRDANPVALAGSEAVESSLILAAGLETRFTIVTGDEFEKALACNPLTSNQEPEADGLNLVEGPLLASHQLVSRACEASFSLHPETADLGLNPQRGPPLEIPELHQGWFVADPKTRIGGFRLELEDLIGGERHLTLGLQRGYLVGRPGLTEDERPDPWGLFDPAAVGAKVRKTLAPLKEAAEQTWDSLPRAVQVGYGALHRQNPVLFPTPQSSVEMAEATLAKPFEVGYQTGTLIGEKASGLEIAASVADDVATTITTATTLAGVGERAAVSGSRVLGIGDELAQAARTGLGEAGSAIRESGPAWRAPAPRTGTGAPVAPTAAQGASSRVLPASRVGEIPSAAPGTDTVVLGPYTVKVPVGGGRMGVVDTLQTLENTAARVGGRVLADLPGNMNVLAPEIQNADRILFYTRPNLQAFPRTWAEMLLIQSDPRLLPKTTFIYGGLP